MHCMCFPNAKGQVPAERTRRAGAQSVGQMPLDVRAIGCDWLTGTARKFLRGPRGVGFLYASRCDAWVLSRACGAVGGTSTEFLYGGYGIGFLSAFRCMHRVYKSY